MTREERIRCDGSSCRQSVGPNDPKDGWIQVHLLDLVHPLDDKENDAINALNATHFHSASCASRAFEKVKKASTKRGG